MLDDKKFLFEFIDDMPIGIARTDSTGALPNHYNKFFLEMFGWTKQEVDTLEKWFKTAYPDDGYREDVIKRWTEISQEAEEHGAAFSRTMEVDVTCSNGSIKVCEVRYYRKDKFIYGVFVDVSERKQLEEEHRAHMKHVHMGEMISMIAHQWRQPLTAITTASSTLQMKMILEKYDKAEFQNTLKNIDAYAVHLSNTIDDFRNLFRLNRSAASFKASDLLDRTLSFHENVFESNNIVIKKIVDTDAEIISFENELMQVLLNILNNAVDALNENSAVNPTIIITLNEVKDKIMICIEDNAGGVPEKVIAKIFEPYFSTKSKNGTGLGLYMSKMIIENLCKGSLDFENTGLGAKFTLLL